MINPFTRTYPKGATRRFLVLLALGWIMMAVSVYCIAKGMA